MGKSQRDKGKRCEYVLRNELRRYGFTADRVPSSGAAQGFKGDIKFSKGEKQYLAEMKARARAFTTFYALFAAHFAHSKDDTLKAILSDGSFLQLSSSPVGALEDGGLFTFAKDLPYFEEHRRTFLRFPTVRKWVKDCDMLVIKDNNKPMLYMRFR